MKTLLALPGVLFAFSMAHAGLAAPAPEPAAKSPSKLSGFVGSYSGTILITQSGGAPALVGTAQGRITASKKKENGKVALTSVVAGGGMSAGWNETYALRKRSFSYLLVIASTASTVGTGGGGASIHKKSIGFNGTFTASGASFSVSGSMRKSQKSLQVTETIAGNGTVISVVYTLRKRGND